MAGRGEREGNGTARYTGPLPVVSPWQNAQTTATSGRHAAQTAAAQQGSVLHVVPSARQSAQRITGLDLNVVGALGPTASGL